MGYFGNTYTFVANTTGVDNTKDIIKFSGANTFSVGNSVLYTVPTGQTAITGLTTNTVYYISFANSTGVALSATSNGANINLTAPNTTPAANHNITKSTIQNYTFLDAGIMFTYSYGNTGVYTPVSNISIAQTNTSYNVHINSTSVRIQNTASFVDLHIPTTSQRTSGMFFLNANSEWSIPYLGGLGSLDQKCMHEANVAIHGNTASFFIAQPINSNTAWAEIPLPFTVSYSNNDYNSIWITAAGYIAFTAPPLSINDFSPSSINTHAIIMGGRIGSTLTSYYFGQPNSSVFVVRYEGNYQNSYPVAWEISFDQNQPDTITIGADPTIMSSESYNLWGVLNANDWISISKPIPHRSDDLSTVLYNGYTYRDIPNNGVSKLVFTGLNAGACVNTEDGVAYINMDPYDPIYNIRSTGNDVIFETEKTILYDSHFGVYGVNRNIYLGETPHIRISNTLGLDGQAIVSNGTTSDWGYLDDEYVRNRKYDIGGFCWGAYIVNETILQFQAVRAFRLEGDFAGSSAYAINPATANQVVFSVYKNETVVGSLRFSASTHTGVFLTFNSDPVEFQIGEYLKVVAPNTNDLTLGDFSFTFKGRTLPIS